MMDQTIQSKTFHYPNTAFKQNQPRYTLNQGPAVISKELCVQRCWLSIAFVCVMIKITHTTQKSVISTHRSTKMRQKSGNRLGHLDHCLVGSQSSQWCRGLDWNQNNILRTMTLPMNNLVATVHWSLFYFLPARRRPNISSNLFLTIISTFNNDYNEEIWGKKSLSPAMVDGGVCKGAQLCLHFAAISFQSGSDWSEQCSVLSNWPRGQMGSRQFDQ